jgi:arabinogalactan oligomer/maltooligosaccharide transport system permease protein
VGDVDPGLGAVAPGPGSAPGAPRPRSAALPGADEQPPTGRPDREPRRLGVAGGTVVKLLLLAAVNGLAIYGLLPIVANQAWAALGVLVAATVAINWAYLTRRAIALKYLVPGTFFLLVFQVYPVVYNGYIAFTNYGTGNILTKDQAIERIEQQALVTPPDAVRYQATPFRDGDDLALLLVDPDGQPFLGTSEGMSPVDRADSQVQTDGDRITAVGSYERMNLREAQDLQDQLSALRVPVEDGEIRLQTFTAAVRQEQRLAYGPDRDVLVHAQTGATYEPVAGNFVGPDGERIRPGWRVTTGTANFERAFTSPAIRGPFLRVFVWTYAFALGSVVLQFLLGLLLATTLNKPGMRGRTLYRSILVIPFALPSFMTALVWAGMLNREFGVVNRMLDAAIPWLNSPGWAKVAILLVATWQGFPYMFLICTGALQSIPGEVLEAASVDGAGPFGAFRRVTFPLLLVTVAPLLIASFAFNFNNFNIIYLLTRGGPAIAGAQTPAGHTDILISYTYRLAFEGGRGADYGFAAAISVLIFLMVATVSAVSFRYTKALEEIN